MLSNFFHGFFFHPLFGKGYQFWSGIAGSFLTSIPGWLVALWVYLRSQNCHEKGCFKRGALQGGAGTKWCHNHAPDEVKQAHPKRHTHWPDEFQRSHHQSR